MINGKKIVLTGANSGIGLEVLKLLVLGKENQILAVDLNIDKITTMNQENVIPLIKDVSSEKAIDDIFDIALEKMGKIDIFYANAGYPYYEEVNYTDWDRVKVMFETNVFSPIYSYQKYQKYLDGKKGTFAITVSAIGRMAMPGFTIYSASKFAMQGFQEGIRLEKPDNIQLTCLYPIATNTNFFTAANAIEFEKPFPVQSPEVVAKKMVKGIEKGKDKVCPSKLFNLAMVLMNFIPLIRTVYWKLEVRKFERFKLKVKGNLDKAKVTIEEKINKTKVTVDEKVEKVKVGIDDKINKAKATVDDKISKAKVSVDDTIGKVKGKIDKVKVVLENNNESHDTVK
jgi:short-subunit dehydrogenase